jgi:Ulp1 family protease
VAEVNELLYNFVFHKPEHDHLQRAHHEVFVKLQYQECPQQINGIDCGLFCVGVVLHILVGKTIESDKFSL